LLKCTLRQILASRGLAGSRSKPQRRLHIITSSHVWTHNLWLKIQLGSSFCRLRTVQYSFETIFALLKWDRTLFANFGEISEKVVSQKARRRLFRQYLDWLSRDGGKCRQNGTQG
jgi:hypothetical protein